MKGRGQRKAQIMMLLISGPSSKALRARAKENEKENPQHYENKSRFSELSSQEQRCFIENHRAILNF